MSSLLHPSGAERIYRELINPVREKQQVILDFKQTNLHNFAVSENGIQVLMSTLIILMFLFLGFL